ncbi:MAG: flavin reductase family protein [Syntrophaceae bacterium]
MKQCDPFAVSQTVMTRIQKGAFLTVKAGEALNTMTIGWGLIGFIWQRPVFLAAVRDSRHTFTIIEKASDFTVSVPAAGMKEALMFCGTKSGRDLDKFKAVGLVPMAAEHTVSPVLKLNGIHLECLIRFKAPMNPALLDPALEELYPARDYHTLYFGEILACYETEAP